RLLILELRSIVREQIQDYAFDSRGGLMIDGRFSLRYDGLATGGDLVSLSRHICVFVVRFDNERTMCVSGERGYLDGSTLRVTMGVQSMERISDDRRGSLVDSVALICCHRCCSGSRCLLLLSMSSLPLLDELRGDHSEHVDDVE
ncbi:hypothetical protein PMAYCL1PPCAC_22604, partial [Pristionchus mayeri]